MGVVLMTIEQVGVGHAVAEVEVFIGDATLVGRGTLTATVPVPVTPAAVYVDGHEVYVEYTTFDLVDRVSERSTANFVAWDLYQSGWRFEEGHAVTVVDPEGTIVFSGYVKDVSETIPNPLSGEVRWVVSAVDYHYLCDKRIVADAFTDLPAGDIVETIWANVLSEEGITIGQVDAGPTLVEAVFGYVPVSQAFDSLARLSNSRWWIDYQKRLYFQGDTSVTDLDVDDSDVVGIPKVRRRTTDYRNTQIVRGVQAYTDEQVATFKGNGEVQTFSLGYPIGKVPVVSVNGIAKTVGIRGADSGKDWYWSKGSHELSQEQSGTKLTSSDTLQVNYTGMYPIVVVSDEPSELERLASLEGGTGIVEHVQNVTDTFGRAAAFDIASGLLGYYARKGCEVKLTTTRTNLRAGDIVGLYLADHGVAGDFLIAEITSRDFTRLVWTYDVTLIQGADPGSWAARLAAGLQQQDVLALRENVSESDTVLQLHEVLEGWGWAELVTQDVYACPVPSTTLYPQTNLYPC